MLAHSKNFQEIITERKETEEALRLIQFSISRASDGLFWLGEDGQFIYTDRKPYIFISLNGKLYFSSVTKDDEGYYQCLITVPESQYSHNGGKQSQPIDLFVYESCKYLNTTTCRF